MLKIRKPKAKCIHKYSLVYTENIIKFLVQLLYIYLCKIGFCELRRYNSKFDAKAYYKPTAV